MELARDLDITSARERFRKEGRTVVEGLLSDSSLNRLRKAIDRIENWMLVTRLKDQHLALDAARMAELDPVKQQEFHDEVMRVGSKGFQYLYETYSLYGRWHEGTLRKDAPVLADMFKFLNSRTFLDTMQGVLDRDDLGFVDSQVTRYRRGHFLNEHDDSADKGRRIAAYVLSLTPDWRSDWGGQLQFLDGPDRIIDTFVPRVNTLSIFEVPQPHAVTVVAPYAGADRISITGWLRAGEDPGPDGVGAY